MLGLGPISGLPISGDDLTPDVPLPPSPTANAMQPLVLKNGQIQQLQATDYASINIPYFTFKNRVLNGDFNIWQRGTALNTITTSGTYYPDQWVYTFDGSTPSINVQQIAFAAGQTNVPDNPLYYCECSLSIAASGQTFLHMGQRIEGSQTFQNQAVTISFWAKASSSQTIGFYYTQSFGSGGSGSQGASTGTGHFSLTTSWQKFSYTVTLNTTSGKTIGAGDYLEIGFQLPINAAFTIDIAHVQFEQGSNATQFESRPYELDLLMCKRYYEQTGISQSCSFVSTGSVNGMLIYQEKRAVPTFTLLSTTPQVTVPGISSYTASGATGGNSGGTATTTGTVVFIAGFSASSSAIGKAAFFYNGNWFGVSAEL